MTAFRDDSGATVTRLLGVIAVFAGTAIVLFELVSAGEISLVGAAIGATGGAAMIFSDDDRSEGGGGGNRS